MIGLVPFVTLYPKMDDNRGGWTDFSTPDKAEKREQPRHELLLFEAQLAMEVQPAPVEH